MKVKVNCDGTLQTIGKADFDYVVQFTDKAKTFHKLKDALSMTQRILYGFNIPHSVHSIKKALKQSGVWEVPEIELTITKQMKDKSIMQ